jgi:predicted Zn finger-like uncharacterized protein
MIVTCSSCATRYLVDPAQLGASGRMVRCAKCGHSWMQAPPADMPQPVETAPSASVSGNLPVPARPRRRRFPVLPWLSLGILVAIAAVVVVQGHDAIVAQWPYAERLYRAAGFPDESSAIHDQSGETGQSATTNGGGG